MLFNLYIFNRYAECISYIEWHRESAAKEGQHKLCAGLVSSVQLLLRLFSPRGSDADFSSFTTGHYRLHFFESATGFRFVLLTHPQHPTSVMQDVLREFYAEVFVELVVRDARFRHVRGVKIDSAQFTAAATEFMRRKELLAA